VIGYGHGDRGILQSLLHDDVAAAASDFGKAMLP
jgi:hypothetical protein